MSFCLDTYLQQSEDYKILLSQSGFKDCAKAVEDNSKEIGFLLSPHFWGKGIMPEACKKIMSFAFIKLNNEIKSA